MESGETRIAGRAVLVAWVVIALALSARAMLSGTPLILGSDDAMRLTIVHDFLAGQGWFDHVQHRLNTPYGAEVHWSRLIDLPEAALLAALRLLPGVRADTAAASVWPLLLLLPLLWLTARLAAILGGGKAILPALYLPAFSLVAIAEFAPGRLDHHSVQILLGLAMLECAIAAQRRPRAAIVAGVLAALAIAIGIESLPVVAILVLVFGLGWATGSIGGAALRDFGLSFALAMVAALAVGVAPEQWLTPAVDAISIVYVVAAIVCGLALCVLSILPLPGWRLRLIAGILAGAATVGIVVGLYPAVMAGPYGSLDPWLLDNWIDRISEAEPWLQSFAGEPVYALAVLLPVATALAVTAWHLVARPGARRAWLVYGAFLVMATLVMLLQIRAARIAVPLAAPACATLIGAAWRRMVGGRGMAPILGWIGSWFAAAGVAIAIVATMALEALFPAYAEATTDRFREGRQACVQPGAFADLAGLPPERIMTPIDLGSHMLLFTPHSVVAAPYHRNQQGVLDAFRFFNGPIAEGRAILAARGVTLVVICPAMKEIRGLVAHVPDSFVTLYAAGRLPPWLVEQSLPGAPLKVYAVLP